MCSIEDLFCERMSCEKMIVKRKETNIGKSVGMRSKSVGKYTLIWCKTREGAAAGHCKKKQSSKSVTLPKNRIRICMDRLCRNDDAGMLE